MTPSELALVTSTLLGPVVAVQVSQWLDRSRQKRADRYHVFRTLMATRGTALDPRHVESLNLIDVVFARPHRDRLVREAWKRYHAHLNAMASYPQPFWYARRVELMNDLLYALAKNLRYSVDRSVIETAWYTPSAIPTLEQEQQKIRQGLVKLLDGQLFLPVQIVTPSAVQPEHQPSVAGAQVPAAATNGAAEPQQPAS